MHNGKLLDPADDLGIRNLVARYHHAVFDRDETTWRASWSAECVWSLGPERVAVGVDAAVAIWRESLSRYDWIVQTATGGHLWTCNGHAAGRWVLQEFSRTSDGCDITRVARYDDVYVREGDAWRFAERHYDEVHSTRTPAR